MSIFKRPATKHDDLIAPELDDPEHIDGEPEITDEDLAGRLDDSEAITAHVNLRDEDS